MAVAKGMEGQEQDRLVGDGVGVISAAPNDWFFWGVGGGGLSIVH